MDIVAAPLVPPPPPPPATRTAAPRSRRQSKCSPADEARARKHQVAGTPPPAEADAPGMAPNVADVKRLKHREYVKRSYNKKISTIEALRTELEALEKQHAAMLSTRAAGDVDGVDGGGGDDGDDDADDDNARQLWNETSPLLRRYKQLTAAKQRLRVENDALYQLNASRMKTEGRVHQLLRTEAQLPRVAAPFRFRPLPDAEYSKVIVAARDDILRFMYAPDKLSSGANVFGWTDQRQVVGEELKFALEKRFASLSAFELLQRSWRIFSSPELFPKVYTPSLHVRFHELQRVNEDTVLFYRTISAEGSGVRVRVVFVLTRLKIDEGYMLLFRSIDHTRVRFAEDEIYAVVEETQALVASGGRARRDLWVDKYIWVIFRESAGGGCAFHFGGSTTTDLWLQEVLFIALRWESLAVGPQFALTM